MEKQTSLGVVIGRFQVPELHQGHRALIDYAAERHKRVLILVGCNNVRPTPENPYSFDIRQKMITAEYPNALIVALPDSPVGHKHWSANVDKLVHRATSDETAVLYGGRQSFIPKYSGVYSTVEIPEVPNCSGTDMRQSMSETAVVDTAWRLGYLAALKQQYPVTDPTVDVVIHTKDWRNILLGRRGNGALLRFPGGFVEAHDDSCEAVAIRERAEEVLGVDVGDPRFIGTKRIKDPRYGQGTYGVMTTFFAMEYCGGDNIRAGDDMGVVDWYRVTPDLINEITPEHHDLFQMLLNYRDAEIARSQ